MYSVHQNVSEIDKLVFGSIQHFVTMRSPKSVTNLYSWRSGVSYLELNESSVTPKYVAKFAVMSDSCIKFKLCVSNANLCLI